MAKTKYTLNSYFRVLYNCELFAVNVRKNDLLCFNSMGWKIVNLGQCYYYAGDISEVSTDVLVPIKRNELRDLVIIEVDTR